LIKVFQIHFLKVFRILNTSKKYLLLLCSQLTINNELKKNYGFKNKVKHYNVLLLLISDMLQIKKSLQILDNTGKKHSI